MEGTATIVLVLKNGNGFGFSDVELIARHINGKWKSADRPRIICLWDKASMEYNLGNLEILPLNNDWPGTWSRMALYSPEMEQYRPFLYIDLDTAVITSLENIIKLIKDPTKFITLEDFWQKKQLATGLAWIPAKSEKVAKIWKAWKNGKASYKERGRMDYFLRKACTADLYFQKLTGSIYDFKPKGASKLKKLPAGTDLVCFHGNPRIPQAAEGIEWIARYVKEQIKPIVTVIIPYNKDRGWLQEAVDSVPPGVQLILSEGEGSWTQNFNKGLKQAEGKYIKWLHEDDMLTPNCITDSVFAIESQDVDFIHGNAIEIFAGKTRERFFSSKIAHPTIENLLQKNTIHSTTLMYRREVFDKVGEMDEELNIAEEFEFNLRCLKNGMKIGFCASALSYYRRHPRQKVRVVVKKEKDREREMVKDRYR